MNNQKIKLAWITVIAGILLVTIGAFAKIQHAEITNYLLVLGLFFFFTAWLIIFVDINTHKVYNKIFWQISMFTVPFLAIVAYLPQRNRFIRLGEKLGV